MEAHPFVFRHDSTESFFLQSAFEKPMKRTQKPLFPNFLPELYHR